MQSLDPQVGQWPLRESGRHVQHRQGRASSGSVVLVEVGLLDLPGALVPDPRAHHEGLTPLPGLLANPFPRACQEVRFFLGRDHVGGHPGPPRRQLGECDHVQVPVHGHRDRAWNGCGGHHQHVGASGDRLLPQSVSLFHPETVLFVHHHQTQVREGHVLLQQRMGAHDDARPTGGCVQQGLTAGRGPHRTGEQRHPGGPVGPVDLAGPTQRAEHRADRPVMLLGQDLRRRQQDGLATRVHHTQHGPERDQGLARSHVALEQTVHGVFPVQPFGELPSHLLLAPCEGERQLLVEGRKDPVLVPGAWQRVQFLRPQAPPGQGQLQNERLVPFQALAGCPDVSHVLRTVDLGQGLGDPEQFLAGAQLGG